MSHPRALDIPQLRAGADVVSLLPDIITGHHPPSKPSWSLFLRAYITSFGPNGTGERGGPAIEFVLSPLAKPKDENELEKVEKWSLRAQL